MRSDGRAYAHRIPLAGLKCLERETAEGDGFVLGTEEGKMIVAAEVVGKWESRWGWRDFQGEGKTCLGFSTERLFHNLFPRRLAAARRRHDCRPLFRFGA